MPEWQPGQTTTYHPEGSVIQHANGTWSVLLDSKWIPISAEEAQSRKEQQSTGTIR